MISRRVALLLPLVAGGCGGRQPLRREFPPPNFSYLTPLRLNVATVDVEDRSPPAGPRSLSALSPLSPIDGLKAMARDRLVASGSSGRAVFVIDGASLQRASGGVDGEMAVHLDVYTGDGADRAGFAEARVMRRRTSTDSDEDSRAILYDFVMQMLNDMNVEFEYQVKRSLRDWLQLTAGSAPPPAAVAAEPLGQPVPTTAGPGQVTGANGSTTLPAGTQPLQRPR